jgi:hypothetical protein
MTVILSFTKVHQSVLVINGNRYTDKSTHDNDGTVQLSFRIMYGNQSSI